MKTHYLYLTYALTAFLLLVGCSGNGKSEFVAVNLVGYPTNDIKQAFLVNAEAEAFELVNKSNGNVVFAGSAGPSKPKDAATGDKVTVLDFSDFNKPGTYFIRINEPAFYESTSFKIDRDIYSAAALAAVQSYYYHRCGTPVDNGTKWHYEMCHLQDAPFYEAGHRNKDVTGGWHDAGDYNKFSVNTSLSAALLLYSYQANPGTFYDGQLNIPEASNRIPDILDEVKWGLDWLLKMQREDGGVYHKVSQKKWVGEFLPHNDPSERHIFDVSSAATASFAATTALGSRQFKPYSYEYAVELKKASEKAWDYLVNHPDDVPQGGFKNPPDVKGGEYGDVDDIDERLWAALELYRLTNEPTYLQYFMEHHSRISKEDIPPISWRDVESFVLNTFLDIKTNERYRLEKEHIKSAIVAHADRVLDTRSENSYRNLIKHTEYYWGSNSVGLAYAHDLLQAYELTGKPEYKEGAYDQLHFILGRNPFNLSQITGVGSRAVEHPYHQLSELDDTKEPVPGMLVGGPNNYLLLNDREISPFPAYNYEDSFNNYLVNEVAINFTAIFAYVSSSLASKSTFNSLTIN